MKSAIINGINGQDGFYLTQLLLKKGYKVIGIVKSEKSAINFNTKFPNLVCKIWDMKNELAIKNILLETNPHEFYNFAAYSSGEGMYDYPIEISEINGIAVLKILEAIKLTNNAIRFCQASSREVFGLALESPQNENTITNPRSPYGAAKLFADSMVKIYREHYSIFACSAILYNHESPIRGLNFVSRKITNTAVKIKLGLEKKLYLGNIDTKRDWGYAGDYVAAMWEMLQQDIADDFIIGSGQNNTVRDFCQIAFEYLELDYKDFVEIDNNLFRSSEPYNLVGDIRKAKTSLNWSPSTNLRELIKMMIDFDLDQIRNNYSR